MVGLERSVYAPLIEEEEQDNFGWDKETVRYALSHKKSVLRKIRQVSFRMRKKNLQEADIDDVYNDILVYLHDARDYDINKALASSNDGSIISLEGYVNVCIKYCVLRFCADLAERNSMITQETVLDNDGEECCIFDNIQDENSIIDIDELTGSLETVCKSCEPLRYYYGADLYLIMYIRVLTLGKNIKVQFKDILEAVGIDSSDLSKFGNLSNDSVVVLMAKAVTRTSQETAEKILEKYVYSAELIKSVVHSLIAA